MKVEECKLLLWTEKRSWLSAMKHMRCSREHRKFEVVFPMKEGVISRFTDMQYLLQISAEEERRFTRGSEYLIAVPTDVTEVEKRAFFDLVVHSTR